MDFSDRNAKLNKRLMESWGYDLNEKKGFGEGTPPEGEWYDKKVIVMEDGSLDHPGMCCADAHGGQEHGDWATAQQSGRTEAPVIASLEEGELPPGLEKYKKEKEGSSDESDEPSDSGAAASSDDDADDDIVPEKEDAPGAENERKKRDEPRNYVGRPGHVQNPLHEHEELVKRVVERVVARLQKS